MELTQHSTYNIPSNSPIDPSEDSQKQNNSSKHFYQSPSSPLSKSSINSNSHIRNQYDHRYKHFLNKPLNIGYDSKNENNRKPKLYAYILLPKNYYTFITRNFKELCWNLHSNITNISDIQYDFTIPNFQENILKFATGNISSIKEAIHIISQYWFLEMKASFKKMTYLKVSILIPDNVIGFIIGIDGKNINTIRDESDARIEVFQRNPSRKYRQIEIAGNPKNIALAAEKIYDITFKYINFNNQKIWNHKREKHWVREYHRRPDAMSSFNYERKGNRDKEGEYNGVNNGKEYRDYKFDLGSREREEYRDDKCYSDIQGSYKEYQCEAHSRFRERSRSREVEDSDKRNSRYREHDRHDNYNGQPCNNYHHSRDNENSNDYYHSNNTRHSNPNRSHKYNDVIKDRNQEHRYRYNSHNNYNNKNNNRSPRDYYTRSTSTEKNGYHEEFNFNRDKHHTHNTRPIIPNDNNYDTCSRNKQNNHIKPTLNPNSNSNYDSNHSSTYYDNNDKSEQITNQTNNDKPKHNNNEQNKSKTQIACISPNILSTANTNKSCSLSWALSNEVWNIWRDPQNKLMTELEILYNCTICQTNQIVNETEMCVITFTGTPETATLAVFHLQNYLIDYTPNSIPSK